MKQTITMNKAKFFSKDNIVIAGITLMVLLAATCNLVNGQSKSKQQPIDKPITITLNASQWLAILNYIEKTKEYNKQSTYPTYMTTAHNDTLSLIETLLNNPLTQQLNDTSSHKK